MQINKPDTMQRLRAIVSEMFGPDREAAIEDDTKPWHSTIGAKNIDRIDFRLFLRAEFEIVNCETMFDGASLREIADYIDATTPSTDAH